MRKLILVEWDMQRGPNPIVQFPPEAIFPPKELLLKMWAQHEIETSTNFISIQYHDQFYCSLLKKWNNQNYFIILQLNPTMDVRIFQEILENVANDLITNIDSPQFPHILSDIYKTIKNYSDLDEFQLYLKLFEDKIRIAMLKIFREGTLSKTQLKAKLESKFGYYHINIDLFLTPFLRLGLIEIKDIPGIPDAIFFERDVFCCRIPCRIAPNQDEMRSLVKNLFQTPQILSEEEIRKYVAIFKTPNTKKLFNYLTENNALGVESDHLEKIINNDFSFLEKLEQEKFVKKYNNKVYLISRLHFFKFRPNYLSPILAERYKKGEISIDQLIGQLKYIKFDIRK